MENILAIVAIVISVISGLFSAFTYIKTMERDRKQATLDAYNSLQEQVFDRLNQYAPAEIREIAKDNHSNKYKEVSGLVARIEHFCVGVNQKIYDFDTVYELAHGYFDGFSLKARIEPILDKKQKNTVHDYYAYIHGVLAEMEQETKKRNGRASA